MAPTTSLDRELHAMLAPMAALANRLGVTLALLEDCHVVWSNIPLPSGADCHTLVCGQQCGEDCTLLTQLSTLRGFETQMLVDGHSTLRRVAVEPWVDGLTLLEIVDSAQLDLTELQQLEERERSLEAQLVQAQKMEAVGQMAGGLAHEFNNLLTAIIGNLSLMELEGPASPAYATYLHDVSDAAQRSAELTRQLLLFSRKTAGKFSSLNVADLIGQACRLARHSLPPGTDLVLDLAEDCPCVRGDGTLLHQVLMNLVLNARDASPKGGTITVRARPLEKSKADERLNPKGSDGDYVLLEVSDTGDGMSEEVRQRIFEPFFTTKGVGQGTGLGLAVVYRIVQQHDGWISVDSREGEGTTFHVCLPVCPAKAAEKKVPLTLLKGQGQRVLVVEDDALVLQLLRSTLEGNGYAVLATSDPLEALALLNDAQVELLLSDFELAGTDGFALLREARASNKTMAGLITSGTVSPVQAQGELQSIGGRSAFIAKPFRADELLQTVSKLLQA
jgi:signal transduction histidine kinase